MIERFEKEGMRLIVPERRRGQSFGSKDECFFLVRNGGHSSKSIVFSLDSGLIEKLNWDKIDKVKLYSDGNGVFGIEPEKENIENCYRLIRSSVRKNGYVSKYEIKMSWNERLCPNPKDDVKEKVNYKIVESENKKGLLIKLEEKIFIN